jgi:hypothetical protein
MKCTRDDLEKSATIRVLIHLSSATDDLNAASWRSQKLDHSPNGTRRAKVA